MGYRSRVEFRKKSLPGRLESGRSLVYGWLRCSSFGGPWSCKNGDWGVANAVSAPTTGKQQASLMSPPSTPPHAQRSQVLGCHQERDRLGGWRLSAPSTMQGAASGEGSSRSGGGLRVVMQGCVSPVGVAAGMSSSHHRAVGESGSGSKIAFLLRVRTLRCPSCDLPRHD